VAVEGYAVMKELELDIFFLSRLLEEKFPKLLEEVEVGYGLSSLDIALSDLLNDARRLASDTLPTMKALKPGDYAGLLDLIFELREIIEHDREHLSEATVVLSKLSVHLAWKLSKLPR